MLKPFDRAIVEVDLADPPAFVGRDMLGVDLEPVVLRGDVDPAIESGLSPADCRPGVHNGGGSSPRRY